MGGLVLKSVDEDVCFHPDYVKRGIQCFDEVKSIVVHKYIYLKSYLLRCSIILGCLLLVFGVIIFLSLI
mgnify:CR=1 FL=1